MQALGNAETPREEGLSEEIDSIGFSAFVLIRIILRYVHLAGLLGRGSANRRSLVLQTVERGWPTKQQNLHFGETNTAGARYPDHALYLCQPCFPFSYLRFVWIALSRKVLVREDLKLPPSHPE